MRIAYDADVDILTIDFEPKNIKVSEEIIPNVIADFGFEGELVGFEIMDASKFTDLSEVMVFMSQWGKEARILDASGNFSVEPRLAKSIPAGE